MSEENKRRILAEIKECNRLFDSCSHSLEKFTEITGIPSEEVKTIIETAVQNKELAVLKKPDGGFEYKIPERQIFAPRVVYNPVMLARARRSQKIWKERNGRK